VSHPPRRRSRVLRNVGVSLGVAVALWLGCEAALRLAAPQAPRVESADGRGLGVEDSVLGHRYRPNARVVYHTPEFTTAIAINADGRRDSTTHDDSLAVRVLVLGDSFTFGTGNVEHDVWTAVMERVLRDRGIAVDIVNAGVEGFDTRAEAHYLFELEPLVKPDVVVLGFLASDVYTNQPLDAAPQRSSDEQRAQRAPSHVVALAKRVAMQSDWVYQHLFLVTPRKEYYRVPTTPHVAEQLDVTRTLLATIDEFCRTRGIRFVVISIPQQFGALAAARNDRFSGIDPRAIDRDLAVFARARGLAWIEMLEPLAEAYRTTGVDMFYRLDGHLTADGNRVVGERAAETIAPILSRRPR
jgi:lysophospholipase L1-like esterase